MKHFLVSILFVYLIFNVYSQNYTRDAGVRFGSRFEISYRQFIQDDKAFEGFLGYSEREIKLSVLKEFFQPAFYHHTSNLDFCYGFGVHIGASYINSYKFLHREYHLNGWKYVPEFGFDGILRLDYYIREFPMIISVGTRPYFEFSTYRYFNLDIFETAVEFKYRF